MTIFDFLKLLGGVAFFLFGMNVMSGSLEKMSGGTLEKTLRRATASKTKSLALGMGITIAIQSSSAMTVMLVGLVNSGIMTLHQTVGVIMGSNVGTTLTAWVLALAGIESDNFFLTLLKPESFSPVFAVIGVTFLMFSKRQRQKDVGGILLGFAVLMFGMVVMKESVAGLQDSERFRHILTAFQNPLLGVLVGAVFTGIIQSSAASVGLLQTFASTVGISYGVAIPIIMGQNIGTCVTALLSSIGVTKNAKRVAVVHIYFNIIGTIFYFAVIYGLNLALHFDFLTQNVSAFGVAVIHSIFNVSVTLLLIPFSQMLERLAVLTVRIKSTDTRTIELLDERLLNTPSFAISNCRNLVLRMCETASETVLTAMDLIGNYSQRAAAVASDGEKMLDMYEDKLGTYLVKLSSKELTDADSWEVSRMLRAIGDLERIGDHAVNIMQSAEEMYTKNVEFSADAYKDLDVLKAALTDIVTMTMRAFAEDDEVMARQVEPLEQVIDILVRDARSRHISRIQRGECSVEVGFVWTDLLIDQERVSDHCSNIAVYMIQMEQGSMASHDYLLKTRTSDNAEFMTAFTAYSERYRLPEEP
ncbi:MAG: Na/Pi cotransporter family protein [Oscillospiraceae bacterium]|jgi:phosphate:Na+ symporter|nr:Na/Pi cotransporter family protein [Oscillospiraceae bacterium]